MQLLHPSLGESSLTAGEEEKTKVLFEILHLRNFHACEFGDFLLPSATHAFHKIVFAIAEERKSEECAEFPCEFLRTLLADEVFKFETSVFADGTIDIIGVGVSVSSL